MRAVIRSATSVVFCSPAGNCGRLGVATTVSGRPSGAASSARTPPATLSLPSRATSTSSSSCRCRSRKLVPTRFQWACLPCKCSSIRSTSTRRRGAVSSGDAVKPWTSASARRLTRPLLKDAVDVTVALLTFVVLWLTFVVLWLTFVVLWLTFVVLCLTFVVLWLTFVVLWLTFVVLWPARRV